MKLPVYLRQSWQIMLKDRQYSLIYIVGVALSMAVVTVFLMLVTMMVGDVYPEKHRGRILVLDRVVYENPSEDYFNDSTVPADLARLIKESQLDGTDAVSLVNRSSATVPVMLRHHSVLYAGVRFVAGD